MPQLQHSFTFHHRMSSRQSASPANIPGIQSGARPLLPQSIKEFLQAIASF